MSYIGQGLPADTFQGFVTDSFTGDGSATTFTLSKEPFSEDTLIVVINNVIQKDEGVKRKTISCKINNMYKSKSKNNLHHYNLRSRILEKKGSTKKRVLMIDTKAKSKSQKYYHSDRGPGYNRQYDIYIKSDYVYYPMNDLPHMGWIQCCIFCNNLTSSVQNVDKYKVYCCNKCNKKYDKKQKDLKIKKVRRYT